MNKTTAYTQTGASPKITVFKTDELGIGAFDNGRITEIKPIPFPREAGGASRLGPLFYWAWASSPNGDGVIPWHPHEGFEIASYVLSGRLGHRDTLGTDSEVEAGGVQLMQAGSGLQHREEIRTKQTDFLQIWFEPNIEKTTRQKPVYSDFGPAELPVTEYDGWTEKAIVGGNSPAKIEAPVTVTEWDLEAGRNVEFELPSDTYWTALVLEGALEIESGDASETAEGRNFVILHGEAASKVRTTAVGSRTRIVVAQAPAKVDYPLLRLG